MLDHHTGLARLVVTPTIAANQTALEKNMATLLPPCGSFSIKPDAVALFTPTSMWCQ
jgi:hypothetical protein